MKKKIIGLMVVVILAISINGCTIMTFEPGTASSSNENGDLSEEDSVLEESSDNENDNLLENSIGEKSSTSDIEGKDNNDLDEIESDKDSIGRNQDSSSNVKTHASNVGENDTVSSNTSFYGIWCSASKSESEAEETANGMIADGFDAYVVVSTDWSNLNSDKWYCVTLGKYSDEEEAKYQLTLVQSAGYTDAYVKYSGEYIGR